MKTKPNKDDTVTCVDNHGVEKHLTKGWQYKVVRTGETSIFVVGDDGETRVFDECRFFFRPRTGLSLKDCFIGKIVLANWSEQEIVHITGLTKNPIGEVIVTVRRPDSQRDVPINPANLFELE